MTYLAVVFAASQWLSWTLPQDFADRGTTFLYRSKDGMSLCRRSGSYKVSGRSLDDFEVLKLELRLCSDMKQLPVATYFVEVHNEGKKVQTFKIIKNQ